MLIPVVNVHPESPPHVPSPPASPCSSPEEVTTALGVNEGPGLDDIPAEKPEPRATREIAADEAAPPATQEIPAEQAEPATTQQSPQQDTNVGDSPALGIPVISVDSGEEEQPQRRRDAARHTTIDFCIDVDRMVPGREYAITFRKPHHSACTRNVIFLKWKRNCLVCKVCLHGPFRTFRAERVVQVVDLEETRAGGHHMVTRSRLRRFHPQR